MNIQQIELPGHILKVKLVGSLDIAGADKLGMPLSVIAGSREKVIVDLSGVGFLASIGIRVLVTTARTLQRRGGQLVVYSPSAEAHRVMLSTGVDRLFPIEATEADATARVGAR